MSRQTPSSGDSESDGPPWPLDRRRFLHRLRVRLPGTRHAIGEAVERVKCIADRGGCHEDIRCDLEIAVHEALANALLHGNSCATQDIYLRCYADDRSRIVVAVRDCGLGFDPTQVPDPRADERRTLHHGRGLLLMRELTDQVVFRKGGCEVVLYMNGKRNPAVVDES